MLKRNPIFFKNSKNQSGQNVVEYALLIVAVMVIVIAFIGRGSYFRDSIEGIINGIPENINRLNDEIFFNIIGNAAGNATGNATT